MKYACLSISAILSLLSTTTLAGNLDYTKTPIDIIFESGNQADLSFGYAQPDMTGNDASGNAISNVGHELGLVGGALKLQITSDLSLAVIYDQPYGVDIFFEGNPTSTPLGGTVAKAETDALSLLLGYHATDHIMVYGGPRLVGAKGDVALSGSSYGMLSGYDVRFSKDHGAGYVLGAAYEIPEIALRAAFTYHSPVDLEMQTTETFSNAAPVATGLTRSTLPQSAKLQFQSGVARNTLAFASIRWSNWSAFTLDPPSPTPNLAVMEDAWTYEVGVGHQFTGKFSASLTYSYEHEEGDDLTSPLAPTKGYQSISVGGKYQVTDAISLSSAIQYSWLGNAGLETSPQDVVQATFHDNKVIGMGLKVGVKF